MRRLLHVGVPAAILFVVGCVFVRNADLCKLAEHNLGKETAVPLLWIKPKVFIPRDGLDPTLVGLAPRFFLINIDVMTGESKMRAFDALAGEELWTQPAKLGDSLLTTDNAVYKGTVDQVEEYDPKTGSLLHAVRTPSIGSIDLMGWSGNDIFALASGSGRSLIYDMETGKVELSAPLLPYTPFVIEDDILYLADAEGFRAKDNSTGRMLWTFPVHEPITLHALFTQDMVILRTSSGNIYALSRATGALTWKLTDSASISNLAQDETSLYFLTAEGGLEVIDKRTGQEIQHLRLSNTPFITLPPEARIGSYDVWIDIQNRILVGSLGDSCQLFAISLAK